MNLPIHTIAAKIITLPTMTFARTLGKLDTMLSNPESSTNVVASVLASDPQLTAQVIGRANASGTQELTQVGAAMGVLGLASVHGLIRDTRPLPDENLSAMSACYAQANACATMCRILARRSPIASAAARDEETLHILGLLHDLGTIAAILHFPDPYARACARLDEGELAFHALLKEELGASPGKLGALWARALNLPRALIGPIHFHMRPARAESDQEMTALAHIARILVRGCGYVVGQDVRIEAIEPETLTLLGLTQADLESAIADFHAEMEELELFEGTLIQVR